MLLGSIELFIALLIAAVIVAVVAHWVRLSYTLALLLFGLAIGVSSVAPVPELNSDVILLLFLPPLIFESAFALNLRLLWATRVGLLMLAGPGVLVAMITGGAIVHWLLGLPWAVALLFGVIVAATDPVAVLVTFRDLGVNKRLAILVEGESLLNDGIALVLLFALVAAVDGDFQAGSALLVLVLSVGGGILTGVICGGVGHLLIATIDDHLTEMGVSIAVAYGSFLVAQELGWSGVLATISAGMTLGWLGRRHRGWAYSDGSQRLMGDLWVFLAFVANAALFLLVGLTERATGLRDYPGTVMVGVAAALLGRAATAYGVGTVLNWGGFRLGWDDRHVLFWGGLRGAVSLAAVLSLPPGFPYRGQLLAMTYGAVLFTLLVQGSTIGLLVRQLGLVRRRGDAPVEQSYTP